MPALFHAGGAHGIRPAELSPPEQAPPRSRGRLPRVPFLRSLLPPPERRAGVTGRGFRGLTRPSVPCGDGVMSAAYRRMLPWDSPFQGMPANAFAEISPRVLPRAWDTADSGERPHRAPRSVNQRPPDPNWSPATSAESVRAALIRFSHPRVPEHSTSRRPGYVFTFRRVARCRRPADDFWTDAMAYHG